MRIDRAAENTPEDGVIGLLEEAAQLQATLDRGGFRSCFIGGVALQCWGQPRYTQDLDVQLAVEFGSELEAARRLSDLIEIRTADAVTFAASSRVFLGRTEDGTPVDIAFGGTPYEVRVLDRASMQPEFGIRVCSAEDLVVMKAFAGRDQDWVDVLTILIRRGGRLDWGLIEQELLLLIALRGESELPHRLVELRRRPGH